MSRLLRGDGSLAYEEAGNNDPVIVFVHGWTADRSNFAPQLKEFSQRNRCLALDLRGHGESDAPDQDYTIDGFADDVAWVCDELGVANAVVVGHSMGGAVVVALSGLRPDLVRALVLLDPGVLMPADTIALLQPFPDVLTTPVGPDALRALVGPLFSPFADSGVKQSVIDGLCRTKPHVASRALRSLLAYDAEPALIALTVPLLYIAAEPELAKGTRLRELCPQAMVAKTAGAGHFLQLEAPEQVNAMLRWFLDSVVGQPSS